MTRYFHETANVTDLHNKGHMKMWILQYLCGYENLYIQYCFHYGTDSIYAWSMINIRCYVERRVRVCQSYTLCHKKTGPLKLFIITLRKLL